MVEHFFLLDCHKNKLGRGGLNDDVTYFPAHADHAAIWDSKVYNDILARDLVSDTFGSKAPSKLLADL